MIHRLLAATVLLLAIAPFLGGCRDAPKRSLHGQRNLAYLHALRDADEGYQMAIEILQGIMKHEEASFEDALNLGRAMVLHSNRGTEALAAITQARQLGSDANGLAALDYIEGLFYKAKQDHAEAHDLFRKVLAVRKDHPEALYQCAYAAERAGRLDDAKTLYERLIELNLLVRPAAYRLSRTAALLKDEALANQAIAVFQSRNKNEKPETTKCDLTDVSLRRFDRAGNEPERMPLTWNVVTHAVEKFQQALPCPVRGNTAVEVVIFGQSAVWLWTKGNEPEKTAISIAGETRGVVIDLDNKTDAEIVFCDDGGFRAIERGPNGTWQPARVEFPERRGAGPPMCMATFDEDHDGDLDIVLITGGDDRRLLVLRNRGDRRFEWKTPFEARIRASDTVRLDAHDLDQANDLDLLFPGSDQQGAILSLNLRGDRYRQIPLPQLAGRTVFAVEDFDNDGAPDIFAAGGAPGWTFLRNADPAGRPYQVRFAEPETRSNGLPVIRDVVPADLDNDGDLDLVLATGEGVLFVHNTGGMQLTGPLHHQSIPGGANQLEVADLDGDGVIDIVLINGEGSLVNLFPSTPVYPALVVIPEGRKDNRSSIGTVTEIYADKFFQSRMIKGPFGVRFGLGPGGLAALDGLRMRWPQGIRQAMPTASLKVRDGRVRFRQIEGLVASCPFLYVKGEKGWTFLTDVLGIAPLAEWMAPGQAPNLDPEEFVRIPGDRLAVENGVVRLAITEELKETTYLDRLELLFVDHPTDQELLIDENLNQGAYDELRIHWFADADTAALADASVRGVGVATSLARRDRAYVHPYEPAPSQWGGWSRPHTMELTTAEPSDVLLMEGRLGWYDSTVSYALAQNGRGWQPMRIDRIHADGKVERLVDDAGGPTGMDRTMIVPLGSVLPAGTRLRITAQHRFLWDRIRTARTRVHGAPEAKRAALSMATLYHHGYSEYEGDPASLEQGYEFTRRAPDDRYPRARGFVNEYGDVRSLVTEHDDELVVLVAGDAVALEFDAPPVPSGMTRTWFLRISGWAKESGFHNQTGAQIAPLPFRGMGTYPPPPGMHTPWRDAAMVLTRRVR